jgi:ATP phosphoribosyltransferase
VLRLALPSGRFLRYSSKVLAHLGAEMGINARRHSWNIQISATRVCVKLVKIRDIPLLFKLRHIHLGVCSDEWMREYNLNHRPLLDLRWCVTQMVYANRGSQSRSKKRELRIATPFPRIARRYFQSHGVPFSILHVSGSSEALVPDICDGLVDCSETGETLKANRLTVRDTLFESSVGFYCLPSAARTAAVYNIRRILERHCVR